MSTEPRFFATAPLGLTALLAAELRALGATEVRAGPAGVAFGGPLAVAYRACLWSRLANRILLPIARFAAPDPEALYAGIRSIDWSAQLAPGATLAVDFISSHSAITHTLFGAQKVKDAIVDHCRAHQGWRPSVDLKQPDVRVNVHLERDRATVSIDLSGDSLHRRGYRMEGGPAPLKENLAAAILLRAGWPEVALAGGAFIDPMCGSGTLPIEAALLAADWAPGLLRSQFGLFGWRGHDPALWQDLVAEARERAAAGLARLPMIAGYDRDPEAVRHARANLARAGLEGRVRVERKAVDEIHPCHGSGLLVANPPYGQRLGSEDRLESLYRTLGSTLKTRFRGWRASVFTGTPELASQLGLRPVRRYVLYNGALPCTLFNFELKREPVPGTDGPAAEPESAKWRPVPPVDLESGGARMFANRLRKNLKHLGRWARHHGIACYRVYDADLPDYAVAIDLYAGEARWAHVQEYAAPPTIDPGKAEQRLREAVAAVSAVLEIPPAQVFVKVRRRQKGKAQYQKLGASGRFHVVEEGGLRFWVNFEDYLDTGLFLDHRLTRALLRERVRGRRFLNLFGYTGTATVYAAAGGACATTTVDLSRTYLEWARRNLELNGLASDRHRLVQADCRAWLEEALRSHERYHAIFVDPPTFSTSKRMIGTFDVQRDHVELIRRCAELLTADGWLLFSTHHRRFRLDAEALADLRPEDLSRRTLPRDFARNPHIHACWEFHPSRCGPGVNPAAIGVNSATVGCSRVSSA